MPVLHRGREPPKPTFHDLTPKLSDQREGWQLYRASNGLPFYFNRITGESVWARKLASAAVGGSIVGRHDGIDNNEESIHDPQRMGSSGVRHTPSAGTPSSREGSFPSPSSSPRSCSSSSGSKSSSIRGSCSSSSSGSKSSRIRGSSTTESSQESETSSDDTWTGSMERKFRHFVRSVEGRKMLADEVQALTARGATRGQPWRHQPPDTRRQRVRGKPAQGLERDGASDDCDADDVEVALLKGTGGGLPPGVTVDSYEVTETSEESSSSGASKLSLLSDDVVLRRLEGIERALIVARATVQSMLHALCGVVIHVSGGLMQSLRRWGTRPRLGTDGTFHSASQ